ncbi:hypothetical protein RvY_01515-2 [Ramazzottius varieornatus]|nr:hypothetical protein RvY_01515-2 [Ramazzottius varieornatus]
MDFLEQLDGLHDHLSTTFVGYHAPSFRVTRDEWGDGTEFYLHYYSTRPGLGPVVVGVLKASLKQLFNVDCQVEVSTDQEEEQDPGEICFFITMSSKQKEIDRQESNVPRPVNSTKSLISPQSFSHLFPFHITFNRDLEITSCGNVVRRLFQSSDGLLKQGLTIDSMFEIVRPRLTGFSFMNILALINTTYVLRQRVATTTKPLKLRGRMTYQWQSNTVIFLCSPSATDLQDLFEQGVYLTDIPVHDAVKDLILMSEVFAKEQEAAKQMEAMTQVMQSRLEELETEKKKTDRLIYSVVPPAIADDLRCKRTIPSLRYDDVTLMFSSVDGFAAFSSTHHPIEIVRFLNRLYTMFDAILDPRVHSKVYKVETIADNYIVVSGCPVIVEDHALAIANLALDLVDRCERIDDVTDATRALKTTIGIHSGEIVAGIIGSRMPRYCLFGDTINLTSRTAAYGKRGFINVTEETYT